MALRRVGAIQAGASGTQTSGGATAHAGCVTPWSPWTFVSAVDSLAVSYQRAGMIPRYTPADFAELWSSATKYASWLEVELSACEAMEAEDLVPEGTARRIRDKHVTLDADRIDAIERTVKHDVIAFLTHVEEVAGADARWLHRGMTSSDVLDTSLALLLVRATKMLEVRLDSLIAALARRADEHRGTPMIGRSHGMHAEPITFGLALAGHLAEMKRCRRRVQSVRTEIGVGKIAGAVGTYAHFSPDVETRALAAIGLAAETVSTQVVARDRHASFFGALAVIAASVERLATNVRHWQRTEVAEAEEHFTKGQKGSSAMPHKRNPIVSENLCGLARIVRAAALPALEDVALWHERDISHSAVERIIGPDATTALGYMLERATALVDGLAIYPDALQANLARSGELYFGEAVLLALVAKGSPRQAAYELVQRCAMQTLAGAGRFRDLLSKTPEIADVLGTDLDRCFDQRRALAHVDAIIDRAIAAP
jgi:adenylosuccinate lyase